MCSNLDVTLDCMDVWQECLSLTELEQLKIDRLESTMDQYMDLPRPFRQNDISTCNAYVSRGLFQ